MDFFLFLAKLLQLAIKQSKAKQKREEEEDWDEVKRPNDQMEQGENTPSGIERDCHKLTGYSSLALFGNTVDSLASGGFPCVL